MPAPSEEVLRAVRQSHTVISRGWLLQANAPVLTFGSVLPGGTVTLDVTQDNMRSVQLQAVQDPATTYSGAGSAPLSAWGGGGGPPSWVGRAVPDGVELRLQQGIAVNSTATAATVSGATDVYWWDVGVFAVDEVDVEFSSSSPGPVWTISGSDRSSRVSRNSFESSYTVKAGTPVHQAIYSLMMKQAKWLYGTHPKLQPTGDTPWVQSWQRGDDPWQAAVELAQSAGMVIYFDASGRLVLRKTPLGRHDPTSFNFVTGQYGLSTDIKKVVSNQPGYNGVQVTATNSKGAPLNCVVWDTDPRSETYYRGPYGKVPAPPVQLAKPVTAQQLARVAKSLLPSVLGLTRSTSVTCVPLPFLDAYDLAWVHAPELDLHDLQMVSGFTLPLDYSGLEQITCVPRGVPPSEYVSAVADLSGNYAPVFA